MSIDQPKKYVSERVESPEPRKKFPWRLVNVALVVLIVVLVGVFTFRDSIFLQPLNSDSNSETVNEGGLLSNPTPMPFVEMTIPYLREKSYDSELGQLEPVGQNGSYNSYLTSFTSDGLRINGLLTIPTGDPSAGSGQGEPTKGWPAIVFIHGYIPPTQYETLGQYADYVDYLAQNGFVVFKIDLRGHGSSEGEAGGGYFGSDYVTDTLNAYTALSKSDFVNPDSIGLWGHSMAGNIVMRSMAAKTDIPAGVIWAGAVYSYTDMQKYGIDDNSYRPPSNNEERQRRRRELFEKHGSPSAQSNFWRQVAPTTYLNDMKGAVQLNHAVNDDVVNIGYSRDLNALLNDTDVVHELHEYQSGGHNISGSAFVEAMQNTVNFFQKYLSS